MATKVKKAVTKKAITSWANSSKTKAQIKKAFNRSEETIASLRKARQINPEALDKPITM